MTTLIRIDNKTWLSYHKKSGLFINTHKLDMRRIWTDDVYLFRFTTSHTVIYLLRLLPFMCSGFVYFIEHQPNSMIHETLTQKVVSRKNILLLFQFNQPI